MKVLITGITGRVGSHLTRLLLAQDIPVRGLVMPADPLRSQVPPAVEVIPGDLNDREAVEEAVAGVTHIVHLAAVILYHPHEDELIWRINVEGTHTLLHAIRQRQQAPLHLVFASSDQVYPGPFPAYVPTDESHPLHPTTTYGMSKLLGEEMIRFTARTIPEFTFTIVRFCHNQTWEEITSPQGPFASRQFFVKGRREYLQASGRTDPITLQTLELLQEIDVSDEPLLLPRDENGVAHTLDMLETRDISRNLLPVLFKAEARNEVFNFAPLSVVSFADVVPYMAQATGRRWVSVQMPGPAPRSHLCGRKARTVLGMEQRYTIRDMIDNATAEQPT